MNTTALPVQADGEGDPPGTPEPRSPGLSSRPVIPLRHPGRWIVTAIALVLLAQYIHGLATNPFYEWPRVGYWFTRPVILSGLRVTLVTTAWSALFGFAGGVVLALCRLSRSPLLRVVAWAYIWFFRSVPLIVVLLFLFNFSAVYKTLSLGIPFGYEVAHFNTVTLLSYEVIGIVGLSVNEAAYAAELVRGGILAVDQGQIEAANALGLPRFRQLRRVVLPQALRTIVPGYVNQLIGLIKASALLYYVSLTDLFGAVQQMGSTYPSDIIPTLEVAALYYLILTTILSVIQYYIERFFARGVVRTLPPTPLQRLRDSLSGLRNQAANAWTRS